MSETGDIYSFLPWLRRGIAGRITASDHDALVKTRATVRVDLKLTGEPVSGTTPIEGPIGRDIAFFGPGDVVGIDRRAVVRTEPRHWITNFEPNYLAHIEFYDEDFPWRYTPAAPSSDGLRLRPWIALIVLEEGVEFAEGQNVLGRPLPFIAVTDLALLPPADELWAWAHVHVNAPLSASDGEFVTTDPVTLRPRAAAFLDSLPDRAASRIVCPRRLKENTPYHAFLVPTFETGRLAGLGLNPVGAPFATTSAWAAYAGRPDAALMPIYHRWYFRTGARGDFEYLVKLLKPRPVDRRVGTRPIDVQRPGVNLPGITDPALAGVLKLGGALKVPRERFNPEELAEVDKYDNWDRPGPHPFQAALAAFVNLPDDYEADGVAAANAAATAEGAQLDFFDDASPDPLITAPLYGRWHALTRRLLRERDGTALPTADNWVHQLNLDPRHRVAAGSGTRVIRANQEDYVNAAWDQVGAVLEANRRIRWSQFAGQVSLVWHGRAVLARQNDPDRLFAVTAPAHRRVLSGGETVRHRESMSPIPPVFTAPATRRALRPGARLARTAVAAGVAVSAPNARELLARANSGEIAPAPPKRAPSGTVTLSDFAGEIRPKGLQPWLADWLRGHPTLVSQLPILGLSLLLLLALAFAFLPLIAALTAAAALIAAVAFLLFLLSRWAKATAAVDSLTDETASPGSVDNLPEAGNFAVTDPDAPVPVATGGPDSAEAVRFKTALRDWLTMVEASSAAAKRPPRVPLDLNRVGVDLVGALDPRITIPARTRFGLGIPARITARLIEPFGEVMVYPVIDIPMYEPLKDLSAEFFLPNIGLIPADSITLLETNQPFIESYMVGVNHEFARELLWREYPTDQRGSTFRQFWDVRSVIPPDKAADEAFRERLRDIPKLHRWPRLSKLGEHDARERPGESEDEVVLVIRGELLKKYPTAIIYAHKADWTRDGQGRIVRSAERILVPLAADEEAEPPREKKRFPLYEAKVQPDIYFFGFDLTAEAAKGGTGESDTDDAGWFFVIQERPGEPRFGFDMERSGPIQTVNDLSWPDALAGAPPGTALYPRANVFDGLSLSVPPGPDVEKLEQHQDDVKVLPAQTSAARWAYILYQAPVMVAVHAAEMLKPD